MFGSGSRLATSLVTVLLFAAPAIASTSLEGGVIVPSSEATRQPSLGIRFGPARPGTSGAEIGLTLFDGNEVSGVEAGAITDLGYGRAIPLGTNASFVPRLGVTALGAVGEGGGGIAAGLVVAAGVVLLPTDRLGLRLDLGYRALASGFAYDSEQLWSVSMGIVWPGKELRRASD